MHVSFSGSLGSQHLVAGDLSLSRWLLFAWVRVRVRVRGIFVDFRITR